MIDPQKVWLSPQLPSLPAAALKLVKLAKNPASDIGDYVKAIQSDPAIAARILKAANSSYFGLSNKVQSIDRALMLLGTKSVIALALGFSLIEASTTPGPVADAYRQFWVRSAVQAATASALDKQLAQQSSQDTMVMGLLLDLGQLAMLKTIPQEYLRVMEACKTLSQSVVQVEKELLGFDHVQIGLELVRRWNLPDSLESAIRLHHAPISAFSADNSNSNPHLPVSRVAATVEAVGEYYCGPNKGRSLERLQLLIQQFWSFSQVRVNAFLEGLRSSIEEIGAMFSIDVGELESPGELLSQANEQLAMIAMSAHAETTQVRAREEVIEREIRHLEAQHTQLRQKANRDTLTGVYNRQFFDEVLARETDRCARNRLPVGVVFFDVDHFKRLNDSLGHACGDEVLRQIAHIVETTVRGSDVPARYGGEEFVILATQPTEKGLGILAERLRSNIESSPFEFEGRTVPATISVGAALTIPTRNDEAAGLKLVQAADEAMYAAKQAGRNRVVTRVLMSDLDRDLIQKVNFRRFSRWLVRRGAHDMVAVSRALLSTRGKSAAPRDVLRETGWFDNGQVEQAIEERARTGEPFSEVALRLGYLATDQLATLVALEQESPRHTAEALARLNLISDEEVAPLIEAYEAEFGLVTALQPA
jgi:diguanylate cyclase (GGDEF)-like protein